MYTPPLFGGHGDDAAQLIRAHPFATLVTCVGEVVDVNHLPLRLAESGRTLTGHMARANPQWRILEDAQVLAIFHGPHAFIPSLFYGEPEEQVPTWNYAVVHVHGTARLLPAPDQALQVVRGMVEAFQPEGHPLPLNPPAPLVQELLSAIVAFEVDVVRVEAKFKLSQNRHIEDQHRVEKALRQRAGPGDVEVAELMAQRRA